MVDSEELLGGFWLYHIIRETAQLILILVIDAEDGYKEGDNHYDPTAPTEVQLAKILQQSAPWDVIFTLISSLRTPGVKKSTWLRMLDSKYRNFKLFKFRKLREKIKCLAPHAPLAGDVA